MPSLSEIPVATVGGRPVTLNDVLYTLKINDRLDLLRHAVDDVLILEAIKREGLGATPPELQAEADTLRQSMGLLRASDTRTWLAERHLTVDDFEQYVWRRITARKLKDRLTSKDIESYFAKNRAAFDSARLSKIVVENEEVARDLIGRLSKADADFGGLAREFSLDESTRDLNGNAGLVRRLAMDPKVAKAVFTAVPGSVVGPLRVKSRYEIIRVEDVYRASLDEETRTIVSDLLFNDWLHTTRQKADVRLTLSQQIAPGRS